MQTSKPSSKDSHRSHTSSSSSISCNSLTSLPPINPVKVPSTSNGIPQVTASAWAIHDGTTGKLLWSKGGDDIREMASLTKMMTLIVSNNILETYKEDPSDLFFTVPREAACIGGTHSGLREGETLSVLDLFYGLMLPSGNDAALTLAFGFGKILLEKRNKLGTEHLGFCLHEFIKEMNKTAASLGLKSTKFSNPHGLSDKANRSTANDLGRIAYTALKNQSIEKIVSTERYEGLVTKKNGEVRRPVWTNTNKLLQKGFSGVKTGTTPTAGFCLSSLLRRNDECIIITVLNAKTTEHRWLESEQLAYWALNNISMVKENIEGAPRSSRRRLTTLLAVGLYR